MRNFKNGSGTILLGEDELEVRSYLEMALRCQGYSVEMAQDGEEVLSCLQSNSGTISAVLLDLILPRKDGFETLKEIRRFDKDLPIIIVSGASTPLNVVEAMKNGATDFLPKPISPEDLRLAIKTALEKRTAALPAAGPEKPVLLPAKQIFLGNSMQMREIQGLLRQVGWSEVPVLIQGET